MLYFLWYLYLNTSFTSDFLTPLPPTLNVWHVEDIVLVTQAWPGAYRGRNHLTLTLGFSRRGGEKNNAINASYVQMQLLFIA